MKTTRIIGCAIVGLIVLSGALVWADSLCTVKDIQDAKAVMKQAEDLERAGKIREAHTAAGKAASECVGNINRDGLLQRTAKVIGTEEEKKGHFEDAFDWYERAKSPADAGRMQRKFVEAKPDDMNTVGRAIGFFEFHDDKAQEQAVRAHALKNVEKALAEEEKHFAAVMNMKDSRKQLELARNWTSHAKAGEDRVRDRAAKRGDTLAAEEGRKFLELALSYYEYAQQPDKAKKVREKALAMAKRHEAKGEGETAADYYALAGDDKKSEAVKKQTEQRQQQAEEGRQKTFKKDQSDLEKSLGF